MNAKIVVFSILEDRNMAVPIRIKICRIKIFYLCCQKHIIKGVAAGAVKG